MTGRDPIRALRANRRAITWGGLTSSGVFALFGVVTDLVPNPIYARMVSRTPADYLFLTLTALLAGIYAVQRLTEPASDAALAADATSGDDRLALGGLVGGFVAVSCPICNVILLSLFGSSAIMTYIDPLRPVPGVLAVALLAGLVVVRRRRACPTCEA